MKDVELSREAIGFLEMYVIELLKQSGKNIHVTKVIPGDFNQFVDFAPINKELKYDKRSGWFSLNA